MDGFDSFSYSLEKHRGGAMLRLYGHYNEINSGCFRRSSPARFACMDHGPVHVTMTGKTLPFKFSSDSTKTSLFVGVRPRQRFFTFSSNSTSTVWPRYFLFISVTIFSCKSS